MIPEGNVCLLIDNYRIETLAISDNRVADARLEEMAVIQDRTA